MREVKNVGSRTTLLWNYILERKGQKHWKSKGYKCSTIENTNKRRICAIGNYGLYNPCPNADTGRLALADF